MIKLKLPVVVEGKYDKITLENIVDALIIPTDGFSIFKNTEKCKMIKALAQKSGGVIVITDSDSAGSMIRAYLKNIIADTAPIINVYIPCLKGKEKRKTKQSKEGLLGLEGMSREVILTALEKSGVGCETAVKKEKKITKGDMFSLGLSGGSNSSENRKKLLRHLKLPEGLSPNAMLDILNVYLTHEELIEVAKKCLSEENKS